jgi:hypothetical protein
MNLPDRTLESLGLLAMLIFTSLLDVIAGNFFTESSAPRQYNKLKLINESLAPAAAGIYHLVHHSGFFHGFP